MLTALEAANEKEEYNVRFKYQLTEYGAWQAEHYARSKRLPSKPRDMFKASTRISIGRAEAAAMLKAKRDGQQ